MTDDPYGFTPLKPDNVIHAFGGISPEQAKTELLRRWAELHRSELAAKDREIAALREVVDFLDVISAYLGCKPPGMVLSEAVDRVRLERFAEVNELRHRARAALEMSGGVL